jgi:hypothetical protein
MSQWLFLSVAIISEVVATSALKASNGFTQLWPSLLVIAGYAIAFFFLSLTLRTMPVGIAYAMVRYRYCARYIYCLVRFWAIARYSRYYRANPHYYWCSRLANFFHVGCTLAARL